MTTKTDPAGDSPASRRMQLPPGAVAHTVLGDSMTPTLPEGTVVWTVPDRQPMPGADLVIVERPSRHGPRRLLKRLVRRGGRLLLESDNPAFPAVRLTAKDCIVGVVVETLRFGPQSNVRGVLPWDLPARASRP